MIFIHVDGNIRLPSERGLYYENQNLRCSKQGNIERKYYREDDQSFYYEINKETNSYTFYHNDTVLHVIENYQPGNYEYGTIRAFAPFIIQSIYIGDGTSINGIQIPGGMFIDSEERIAELEGRQNTEEHSEEIIKDDDER